MKRGPIALALALAIAGAAAAQPDPWLEQGRRAVARAHALKPAGARLRARNVILFLGDGMGVSTVTAARILGGQLRGESGEENLLSFERFPHLALVKTYNTNRQVPDSAGTMTAILTGVKTRAGVLGLDSSVPLGDHTAVEGHELTNLFDLAERRGLSTGVVTTTRVTHATPAAAFARSPHRNWESDADLPEAARAADFPDLARQLIEYPHGNGFEVVLGGGSAQFRGGASGRRLDGRDLTAEWVARRPLSVYVDTRDELLAIDAAQTRHLLGLFAPSHLEFEVDRAKAPVPQPSLTEMTAVALDVLSRNPTGYVLLVEGGRIDHAHHMGNAYRALTETLALDEAIRYALKRVDLENTLVIVTADHSHVLTIAGYPTRGNPILGKVRQNDERGEPDSLAADENGLPYTTLGYQNGPGSSGRGGAYEGQGVTPPAPLSRAPKTGRPDLTDVDTAAPDYLQEAAVPMRSETHSGEDVAAYAAGPGAFLVHGVMEQNALFHVMVDALGWGTRGFWDELD